MAEVNKNFRVKNGLEVGGNGVFDGTVAVSTPTENSHAATKLYVDQNAGGGVTVSDTAPSSPSEGDVWYNSSTGRYYVYYDSYWVEASSNSAGPTGETGPAGADGADGGFDSTQTILARALSFTLDSSYAGTLVINAGAITVTVQGLSTGQQVDFIQVNAGQITFTAGSGVTLYSKDGNLKTAAQYSPASIKCIGTNNYVLLGDLGA